MTSPGIPGLAEVSWLPGVAVPTGWQRKRVKHVLRDLRAGDGITGENIESSGDYPVYGGNGVRGYARDYTHAGTFVLVGRQGALCGNVHLASGKFWASEHAMVGTPAIGVDPRWLTYTLRTMNLGQYSLTAAQPGIGIAQVMALDLYAPGPEEQRAIADFLDEQTARIDTLIEKQTQLISTLRERATAQLSSHFGATDKLRLTSVRRVLRPLVRPARPGLGVITAYRDGVVTLRSTRREDGYTFSESEAGYQEIRPGDLVFHALDGFAGACGVSDSHGVGSPVYHVCKPVGDDDVEYLALLLRFLGTSGYLATQAPNVRQRSVDFRNWATFAQVPLYIPSPAEQRSFVTHHTTQEAQVRAVISKTEQHIALAKERRAALITAAVTGQFDVRTAGRATQEVA